MIFHHKSRKAYKAMSTENPIYLLLYKFHHLKIMKTDI